MAVPAVYQGLVPNKTNGGLTPLQLALANDMAKGQLPFGVNQDFLAAMRIYAHTDPLVPIDFVNQGNAQKTANKIFYKNGKYPVPQDAGISDREARAPSVIRNMAGVMYTVFGDELLILRQSPDCGPNENVYEQVSVGKKSVLAVGSFAYYGRKVIFGGPVSSGSNPNYGCCFIAGTKITMANGTIKNIEDVEIGEQVIGKDNIVNTVIQFVRPMLGERKLVAFNSGTAFMTSDHPVYTQAGWKSYDPIATMEKYAVFQNDSVGQLMPGDTIATLDGQGLLVESIQTEDGPEDLQVYNFNLDGNNTYIANNLVVHNKGPGSGASASCSSPGGTGCSASG
jgi:hypothetical protein